MKRKVYLALFLCLSLMFTAFSAVAQQTEQELAEEAAAKGAAYLLRTVSSPVSADVGGEWTVLALSRLQAGGEKQQSAYIRNLLEKLEREKGVLSHVKYSEYARASLAVSALGYNPRDFGGYDLMAPLCDTERTGKQGVNGLIFALLAWSGQKEETVMQEQYLQLLLEKQLPDGSFSLTQTGEPDVTAMAVQALAAYKERKEAAIAAERALAWLSAHQRDDGGFENWGVVSPESSAQVLFALSEYGVSPLDSAFVKSEGSVLSHLLSFQRVDGGFAHTPSGESQVMTTEQAVCALTAVMRQARGEKPFYDLSEVERKSLEPQMNSESRVQIPAVCCPGKSFSDMAGHPAEEAVYALAERGIINGREADLFVPGDSVSRSELAAILVRALGVQTKEKPMFSDVPSDAWFFESVGTAAGYGLVRGVGDGLFLPYGRVTREEAAVMIARGAEFCGVSVSMEDAAVLDVLAQFPDYRSCKEWARPALAFCYSRGVLSQSEMEIRPEDSIRRDEAAKMLYEMLRLAKLL